jgi:selenocysteine-specific elongation factor
MTLLKVSTGKSKILKILTITDCKLKKGTLSLKQVILGTAGHIDHGKTTLIKALTGTNTDRLKEEKLRGITIELGFASIRLPGGQHLGIVDVPGHEKFVKNMVAGATGIDMLAMVIAADEGVMPQTREHLEICSLLDIKYGLVVLTKTDMVDEEWLELVTDDIHNFTKGTFLESAPIVPVSATTGQGLEKLIKTLDQLSTQVPEHLPTGLFRLPVDRVFTMKGFGTVITGTLVSGSVKTGQTIMIYPSGITSKVRGIQVHNQSVETAEPGTRTAVNFQGLNRNSVARGQVLSMPGALKPSYMTDVLFHFLSSNKKPLKTRTQIRFHTGTSEILGILVLLDEEELAPGNTAIAQIRLNSPVALVKDDRFVLRSYSPVRTIGGGHILNPIPGKHKSLKPETIQGLKTLAENTGDEIIDYHIMQSGYHGTSFSELKLMTNIPEKQLNTYLQALLSKQTIMVTDRENRTYIHGQILDRLKKQASDYLAHYHKNNPLKPGMPKQELKSRFTRPVGNKLFNLIINQTIKQNIIVSEEDTLRLATHKISLGLDQTDLREKILQTYEQSGLTPPYFKDLIKNLKTDPAQAGAVLHLLIDEGLIIKTKEDLYFHQTAINDLKKKLVDFLISNQQLTTPQFKEMTGVSRKFLIPLIEYFDSKNITIRIGDIRKLRKTS